VTAVVEVPGGREKMPGGVNWVLLIFTVGRVDPNDSERAKFLWVWALARASGETRFLLE